MSGIYIHIPFCIRKCHYCDFYSIPIEEELKDHFLSSLKKEISLYAGYKEEIETIYFGGGTPSLLSASEIDRILQCLIKHFRISENPEITLEANPGRLDGRVAREYLKAGINRLSIGVQSLSDNELRTLGRIHDSQQASQAIACVMEHFENFSVDIIYGIPGQSVNSLKKTLCIIKDHEVPHVSAYELTIEEHTVMAEMIRKGFLQQQTEEEKVKLYWTVVEELKDYTHYEVSNYSKEGFQCRHNMGYWLRREYLGFGPSAHGLAGDKRYRNLPDIERYINALDEGIRPVEDYQSLSERQKREERVFLGLRTNEGIGIEDYDFNRDTLKALRDEGLLLIENGRLRLTDRGMLLSNRVIAELLWS